MAYTTILARDEQGNVDEVLFDGPEVPGFGEDFVQDGQAYTRVVSAPRLRVKTYDQIVGWSVPRKKDAIKRGLPLAKHYDHRGRAIFNSRREINEFVARSNANPNSRREIAWDPDGNE